MTTAPARSLTLKTAIGTYGHTAALKNGNVKAAGIEFEHIEVSPITPAFRRMTRDLEFDISEMAVTTYLAAKAFGKPFTAIPVVPVRSFHHGLIIYNTKSGISGPKDLEGRKVGVRAYTVTQGVWVRGILATEYGVDLRKVTWVLADDEHVQEYKAPSYVVTAPQGKNLVDMLLAGEIDAAIGVGAVDSPDVKPLISDARNVEADWYRRTGIFPISHVVVVKDSLLSSDPWIAPQLFAAFKGAKELYMERLNAGSDSSPAAKEHLRVGSIVGDPLPYGLETNRKAMEAIIQYAYDQEILPSNIPVEEWFVPGTIGLA